MSIVVLGICVICYFIANIYQNKFSSSLEGQTYPMNYFQITWMSIASIAFCIIGLLMGDMSFSKTTIFLGSMSGIMTILGGMSLMGAMARGSLSMTILIHSMYIIIPPILAVPILHESVSRFQILAIVLIIIVIFLSNTGEKNDEKKSADTWWWLLCIGSVVFIGMSSFVMKYHQNLIPGQETREFTIVSYLWGIVVAILFALLFRRTDKKKGLKEYRISIKCFIIPAIIVAIVQGGANMCNLYNAAKLPAIVLYPVTQLSTLMLTVIYGILILREKPTARTVSCLVLGVVAIILMNI